MKIRSKILIPIYVFIILGFTTMGAVVYVVVAQNNIENELKYLETRSILSPGEVVDNSLSEITGNPSEISKLGENVKSLMLLSKYQSQQETFLYETVFTTRALLLLAIACMVTFSCISFLILKFIKNTISPLLRLAQKIEGVRQGKKDTVLDVQAKDEIRGLASNLEEMIHELNTREKKIKKKVQEQIREIRDKQKETEILNKDLLKFQEALKKASDYIAILNNSGEVVYINTSLEKETGYSLVECLEKQPQELWRRKEDPKKIQHIWTEIETSKKSQTLEMTTTRKDGTSFISDVHISPILNKKNEVEFFLTIESDITQEKQVEKMKDEFISLVSHELRTPMTVIGGFTKLFLKEKFGPLNNEQKKYLERIDSNTKYLIHMVNDMLDIGKLNSGKIEFHDTEFNIYKLLKDLKNEFSLMCKEKNICLSLSGKSYKIKSDPEKIKEVVMNLIRNAYKFTPVDGKVSIKLSFEKKDFIKIEVKDTGIGIKKENFGRIFEKFGQVESYLQKNHKGTGLGLNICKLIVEKLGGRIGFDSTYEKGSTFYFILPTAPKVKTFI